MVNTTYISTEKKISKLQELKGKTKLKVDQNTGIYYDEMNTKIFRFEEDPFAKDARGNSEFVMKY